MALSITNNVLQTLVSTGNDAQNNLYEVGFEGGILTDLNIPLSVRCSGFKRPETSQDSYQVHYITAYIDRPVTKVNVTRNFSLDFRSDDNWLLYKALLDQQKVTMSAVDSFVNTNISDLIANNKLFNVYVNKIDTLSIDEDRDPQRLFNFKHCWIESITPPNFTNSDSSPIIISCTINFIEMEDWQSGLFGDSARELPLFDNTKSLANYD